MRKTIAVCVTGYNWQKESRIISGIVGACQKNDINLLCFASLETKPGLSSHRVISPVIVKCESEIFHLINYKKIDGLICLSDEFLDASECLLMQTKCLENNIPFVNISSENDSFCHNIIFDTSSSFETIVRHIVEFHGARKVNFISGFKDNLESEERLEVYKKVLTENNIPIEDFRIAYGEFWKKSVDCAREFLEHDMPDAIICANDTMAILVTDYLMNRGIKVPQEIMVSGFDGTDDAQKCDTSITTIVSDFVFSGEKAVELLKTAWAGGEIPKTTAIGSMLIKAESCGCVTKRNHYYHNYIDTTYQASNNFKFFSKNIMVMNNAFINAKTSSDIFKGAIDCLSAIALDRVYICLNPQAQALSDFFYSRDYENDFSLPEEMLFVMGKNSSCKEGILFNKGDYLPEDIFNGPKAVFLAFSPFYILDKFLGYIAYEPKSIQGEAYFFRLWLTTLANNIASFCMREGLEHISMHDPLTGLLNRRGMTSFVKRNLSEIDGEKYISIICLDVDNLKKTNDTYGHDAGDTAILTVSQAIKSACPKDAISTRTGGDEFSIALFSDSPSLAEKCISAIYDYLENFNREKTKMPCPVACSAGYSFAKVKDLENLDDIMKDADLKMYKVKAAKKATHC